MSGVLAPAEIFAAVAGYSDGSEGIAEGTHLRLLPSPALGFPLGPFAIWPVKLADLEFDVVWTDREGGTVDHESPDLSAHDGELHGYVSAAGGERMAALELSLEEGLEPSEFALLDGVDPAGSRLVAERIGGPWCLAAPRIEHFRVRGTGIVRLRAYGLSEDALVRQPLSEIQWPGLPIDEELAWYGSAHGAEEEAFKRVKRGAPPMLGPPDAPDGAAPELEEPRELERVEAVTREVPGQLHAMLGKPNQPPWLYRDLVEESGEEPPQRAYFEAASGLLLQALDPGVGRILGLMSTLERTFEEPRDAWAAAGAFALDRDGLLPDGRRAGDVLEPAAEAGAGVLDWLASENPRLGTAVKECQSAGFLVVPLITLAAAPPMPERPAPPDLAVGEARWLADEGGFSKSFRRRLLVRDAPLAPLVALARQEEGEWLSLHQQIELPEERWRARAMLVGRDGDGRGVLVDGSVPDRGEPAAYRVRLGDLFGRFGEASEIEADPPAHLPPPRPTPQVEFVRAAVSGDGPQSPGSLVVRVPIPRPDQIAPGGRPLDSVIAELGGEGETAAAEGPVAEIVFDLPDLSPGGEVASDLAVRFADEAGVESDAAIEPVRVRDGRPPKVLKVAPGILWASRPGPAEEVELRLSWPARSGETYRAYIADAAGLGVATAGRTRAQIAAAIAALPPAERRQCFRLLTDPALSADPSGRVLLDARLPRSLGTVGALCVVPVNAANIEAPFASCPLVAVAVPAERRPPPPKLAVTVSAEDGRAQIAIEAPGLNREELERAEAGLFSSPPSATARAPEYRLRRAVGHPADPVYAPERGRGPLHRAEAEPAGPFAARFEDGPASGLEPYVRFAYWAEVRMPPERRLPADTEQIPVPDGIGVTEPAQAEDMPGLFSAPSPPAYAMRVPGAVPTPDPEQVQATLFSEEAGSGSSRLEIELRGGPTTHEQAVGSHRLRVWLRRPGGPPELLTAAEAMPEVQGELDWASDPFADPPPGTSLDVLLAYVDPLDRQGPILVVKVPAPEAPQP